MPHRITRFETTPNPNALKCHIDPPLPPLSDAARSCRTPQAAAGNPLTAAIFAVPGVSGLLLMEDWLTVNKEPEADWAAIKRGLKRALARLE